jgi:hypothetical protein
MKVTYSARFTVNDDEYFVQFTTDKTGKEALIAEAYYTFYNQRGAQEARNAILKCLAPANDPNPPLFRDECRRPVCVDGEIEWREPE